MDVVEFYREFRRMCKSHTDIDCDLCPMNIGSHFCCLPPESISDEDVESAIKVVDIWSKGHPVITNAQKFEEVFGPVCKCPMSTSTTVGSSDPQFFTNIKIKKYLAIDEDWWGEEYKEQ